jgi:drug/metabolite transporter (DMT)-like permease
MWILWSLLASLCQTVRNATSKSRSRVLSPAAVTLVRFGYGLVVVLLVQVVAPWPCGYLTVRSFWFLSASAALQLTSNVALVKALSSKNLLLVTTLVRVEVPFAVAVGCLLFGDLLDLVEIIAVGLACLGLLISSGRWWRSVAGIGYALLSGCLVGGASLTSRQAILSIKDGSTYGNAVFILSLLLILQTCSLILYLIQYEREEFIKMRKGWKTDLLIGFASGLGSLCWVFAFALSPVGLVKTVGQSELILSWFLSRRLFKEPPAKREVLGAFLVASAVVLLAAT